MPGRIVRTKSGKIGMTNNNDELIRVKILDNSDLFTNKIIVRMLDDSKILCDPRRLEFIGFWD